MADTQNNTGNVSVGRGVKGGYLFRAPLGTPLPTAYDTTADDLDPAFENLGYVTDDGFVNAIETDGEDFKDLNGDTIEHATSEYTETAVFSLAEQRASSLAMEYGEGNVLDSDGQITARHRSDDKEHFSLVGLFILKNGRRQTTVIPDAQVTEVGEKTYTASELVCRELTVTCYPDGDGDHVIDYIESTETESANPRVKATGFDKSSADANAKLTELLGKPVSNAPEETFFVQFDREVPKGTPFLFEIVKDGKAYGTVTTTGGEGFTVAYWSIKDGADVQFVDGVKAGDAASAKCDLADYEGDVTLTVYKTDKQTQGTYPTGLVMLRKRIIKIG